MRQGQTVTKRVPPPKTQEEALAILAKIQFAALRARSIHMEQQGDDEVSRWLHRTLFPYTAVPASGGLPPLVHATTVALNRDWVTGGEFMNIMWMVEHDDLVLLLLMFWDVGLPEYYPKDFVDYLGIDTPQRRGENEQ